MQHASSVSRGHRGTSGDLCRGPAGIRATGSQPELGTNQIVRFVTKQAPAPQALKFGGVLEKARTGRVLHWIASSSPATWVSMLTQKWLFRWGSTGMHVLCAAGLRKNGLWSAPQHLRPEHAPHSAEASPPARSTSAHTSATEAYRAAPAVGASAIEPPGVMFLGEIRR